MKSLCNILITLLALAPAIPIYAMDTTEDVRRSGRKRKQREFSLDKVVATKRAKNFKCTELGCDKAFDKPSLLTRHMRKHTGEQPYKCNYCSRRFNQVESKKRHIMRHHTNFKCRECDKSFSDKKTLQTHEKNHNPLNPFPCPEPGCTESFRTKIGLGNHTRTYHPQEPDARDTTVSSASEMVPSSTSSSATLPLPAPAAESTASPSLLDQFGVGLLPLADHTHSGFIAQTEPTDTALPPLPQEPTWEQYNPEKESLFSLPMPDSL